MSATANLVINLNITCPECGEIFDLLDDPDLMEGGWIADQVMPVGDWGKAHENFKCDAICPKCSVDIDIEVEGVEY